MTAARAGSSSPLIFRFLIHPVAEIVHAVRSLGREVGLMSAGDVGRRHPALDVVHVHEQCHLLSPLCHECGA